MLSLTLDFFWIEVILLYGKLKREKKNTLKYDHIKFAQGYDNSLNFILMAGRS